MVFHRQFCDFDPTQKEKKRGEKRSQLARRLISLEKGQIPGGGADAFSTEGPRFNP